MANQVISFILPCHVELDLCGINRAYLGTAFGIDKHIDDLNLLSLQMVALTSMRGHVTAALDLKSKTIDVGKMLPKGEMKLKFDVAWRHVGDTFFKMLIASLPK
ncbi:hypothetical protein Acr_00g0012410 [Actinidia rufa]|uniref:Uncharacterized protein n=1 Tax=Actinidia rufa TaxID=165716 RepID=A0A7J0D9Q7_9ERIC|nr:hypothetical protein Acr_00g0012410 [Actinidia rufa]